MTTTRPGPTARGDAPRDGVPLGTPPLEGLLLDWATIWASEAAALACDREMQEAWHRAVISFEAALRDARLPGPDAPAGAAPAAAAPAADELAELRRRVGELERRLAGLGG